MGKSKRNKKYIDPNTATPPPYVAPIEQEVIPIEETDTPHIRREKVRKEIEVLKQICSDHKNNVSFVGVIKRAIQQLDFSLKYA